MSETKKKLVFKTVFESPLSQWPKPSSPGDVILTRLISIICANLPTMTTSESLPNRNESCRKRRRLYCPTNIIDFKSSDPNPHLDDKTTLLSELKLKDTISVGPQTKKHEDPVADVNLQKNIPSNQYDHGKTCLAPKLVIGLNEVTRALELGLLDLIIACPDDLEKAHLLLHHIPLQCLLQSCMLLPLPRGSAEELGRLLIKNTSSKCKRLYIVGVTKGSIPDLLKFAKTVLPSQDFIGSKNSDDLLQTYKSLVVKQVQIESIKKTCKVKKGK